MFFEEMDEKAEEEERLRELGYSVAGQKIRKNYKNIAKLLQKKITKN